MEKKRQRVESRWQNSENPRQGHRGNVIFFPALCDFTWAGDDTVDDILSSFMSFHRLMFVCFLHRHRPPTTSSQSFFSSNICFAFIIRIHFFNFIYLFVYYLLNFLLGFLDFLRIILSMYMKIIFKIFFATLFPLFQDHFLQVYYFLNIVQPSFQALKILFPNPSLLVFLLFFFFLPEGRVS